MLRSCAARDRLRAHHLPRCSPDQYTEGARSSGFARLTARFDQALDGRMGERRLRRRLKAFRSEMAHGSALALNLSRWVAVFASEETVAGSADTAGRSCPEFQFSPCAATQPPSRSGAAACARLNRTRLSIALRDQLEA